VTMRRTARVSGARRTPSGWALANKLARMAWTMMARGERYNYPAADQAFQSDAGAEIQYRLTRDAGSDRNPLPAGILPHHFRDGSPTAAPSNGRPQARLGAVQSRHR
jgi:hypothetical protein